jgi:predicted TIM-barrel fold metal-dependent hydrolase
MFNKGASLAADAALEAVRSATGGVIPVRGWVRRFSGAARAEQEAKAVALAGSVRRGYLKAFGLMKGCDWPAAPLAPQVYQAKVAAAQAAAAANQGPASQTKQ